MKKNQLEFYRVIFTLGICIYHARGFLGFSGMQNGYLLVEFFFILSGYFLFLSYKKEDKNSSLVYSVLSHILITKAVRYFRKKKQGAETKLES